MPPGRVSPVAPICVMAEVEPPLPSVTLLLLVNVPVKRLTRRAVNPAMLELRVTPAGLSRLSVCNGVVIVPAPEYEVAIVEPKKYNVLLAVVPSIVPAFEMLPVVRRVLPFRLNVPAVTVKPVTLQLVLAAALIRVALFVPEGLLTRTVPSTKVDGAESWKPPVVALPEAVLVPSPNLTVEPAKFFAPVVPLTRKSAFDVLVFVG